MSTGGRWVHWEDYGSMAEQYHIWIIPESQGDASKHKRSWTNLVDTDSPMPAGLHLFAEPCSQGCDEREKRCEHRYPVVPAGVPPPLYNLQISKPTTLHGKLIQNMLEPLTNRCRAERRHEWLSGQARAGNLVERV